MKEGSMYSNSFLDLNLGFRFPLEEILDAMKAIVSPKENECNWCCGKGYIIKMGNKTFCHPCQGSGKLGGYGRNYGRTPPGIYECPRPNLL